jgi:hypothetical protein
VSSKTGVSSKPRRNRRICNYLSLSGAIRHA